YLLWPAAAGTPGGGGAPAAAGAARPRLVALAWFAAGFGVLAIPWLALSLAAGHAPGSNLIQSFSYYVDPSQGRNVQDLAPGAAAAGYRSLGALLRDQPGALLARLLGNLPGHFSANLRTLVGPPVAWVCGAGLVIAFVDGSWRPMLAVALVGATVFASLVPVFYSDRYALPLLPYYLVFAGLAAGSRALALRITPRSAFRLPSFGLKWAIALVPLVLSIRASAAQQRWVESQLPVEVRAAGEALRRVAPPGSGVLSRKMHLWYYSGASPVAFPRVARLAELADACRRNGAQYLYFSWYEAELRPEFWYLLDSTATVPGLTRIPFPTPHPALLYAIGPGFGRDPDWLANEHERSLHIARAQVRVLNERDAWGAHFTLGEEARAQGDRAAALAHYLAAARGNPRLALAWQRAGDELLALGRYDEAREAYERVRRLAPDDVASQIGIGWTQLRMGRPDLAAKTWWPLVGQTRDEATLRAMAEVFERVGDIESLEGARRALAALPPRKPAAP
ncbi:MAG TPA: tetratricopeptide repeat protein, partial [Candidatus Eisenbacteria bacterium]